MFEPFLRARERLERETGGEVPPSADVSRTVIDCLERNYTIERDESYFMARLTPKCRAVIACCPGVADERLSLLGWEPAADADAAVARAMVLSGGAASEGAMSGRNGSIDERRAPGDGPTPATTPRGSSLCAPAPSARSSSSRGRTQPAGRCLRRIARW